MARDTLHYDGMVENALRGVVRQSLSIAAEQGLPGNHHFYLTFRTTFPGVEIAERLRAQYPSEMTVVLQHQYWGLEAADDYFVVSLSFSNIPERLKVPYAALVSFVDPSVKFGLQFQVPSDGAPAAPKLERGGKGAATVVSGPALALASVEGASAKPAKPAESPSPLTAKASENKTSGDKPSDKAGAEAPAGAANAPSGTANNGATQDDAAKPAGDKVVSLDSFRKK